MSARFEPQELEEVIMFTAMRSVLFVALLSLFTSSTFAHDVRGPRRNAVLVSGDTGELLELSFHLKKRGGSSAPCEASLLIEAQDANGIVERIVATLEEGEFATHDIPLLGGPVLIEARRVQVVGPCDLLPTSRLKAPTGETRATVVVFSVRGITDDGRE